jgi:hypothetical protein
MRGLVRGWVIGWMRCWVRGWGGVVVVVGSSKLCGHPNFVLCWSWVVTIVTRSVAKE